MTAKSENSKDGTTRTSADTRGIRELAEEFCIEKATRVYVRAKHISSVEVARRLALELVAKNETEVNEVAAFAESIVGQERDAVIELIEAFVNDCNDGKWQPKRLIESIRSRWQRGEEE